MNRIEKTFARLRAEHRAALIPFIMGYDPDAKTTTALMESLAANGADLIEIGMPFSDPMADGPVIQAAGKRALEAGATIKGILSIVVDFRKAHPEIPVILMGYFNPVYRYGVDVFCRDATNAGVDGLILVDLPPEEEQEMRPSLDSSGLKLIRLIAPTSDSERLKLLAKSASGFVYYISITGITGAKAADTGMLQAKVAHLREFTDLPVAVGFGIKTAKQVSDIAPFSDAIVVGSALVDAISKQSGQAAIQTAKDFMVDLATGLKH